jgi:hypothetical protein
MSEKGDGLSADLERPADDEKMTGPLSGCCDPKGEDEVARAAALPQKSLTDLNLEDVATLQAAGKRVGCPAGFSRKSIQNIPKLRY